MAQSPWLLSKLPLAQQSIDQRPAEIGWSTRLRNLRCWYWRSPYVVRYRLQAVSWIGAPAVQIDNSIPADNRILYFARDREVFGFMSHFHPSPIVLDGLSWASVEHFYQAQRSFEPDYREAVRNAASPALAKRLAVHPDLPRRASQKSWFRKNKKQPRPDWQEVKLDIMRRGDWAKFSQNAELGRLLLATGSSELIEDSPFDPFWGIGPDGTGPNWAGRVLMEVRDRLRRGEQ